MKLFRLAAVTCIFNIIIIAAKGEECRSPQYIQLGSVGKIKCSFEESAYSLFWYTSTDFLKVDAIVTLQDTMKSGSGYDSGEFDIDPNGSLIVNNVSIDDGGTYTVIKLETPTSNTIMYTISVSVLAETFEDVPRVESCDNKSSLCLHTFHPNLELSCTLRDAPQVIPVQWMVRTVDGDRRIPFVLEITNVTHTYFTSRITTLDPFVYSKILTLLVCKADGPPGLLEKNESLVLLQNNDETLTDVTPKQIIVEKHARLELHCNGSDISFFVWQVLQPPETFAFKTLLYAVLVGENFTHIQGNDYNLRQTSLLVDKVGVQNEGIYRCISGNGLEDNVIVYNVIVFVNPEPAYIIVDGCSHQQYCVLEVQAQGSVTCSIKRIYPQVALDIADVLEQPSRILNFYDKSITTRENGETFNVILTSKYRYNGAAGSRETVKCEVVGTSIYPLYLSTTFELLFMDGFESTTDENVSSDDNGYWIAAVVPAVLLVIFALCVALIFLIFKVRERRGKRRKGNYPAYNVTHLEDGEKENNILNGDRYEEQTRFMIYPEEVIPMMEKSTSQGKREIFITQLKAKYQNLYDAVQPIPYIRDRLYCVDRVFVEGGIEYLVTKDRIGGQGTWGKLCSYHNILDDERVKSKRRIIEGEPGYGKSTLTLQLSYDWCNKIPLSYLKDIDVLILLRLRQLGGVTSVYRAIKQFLLPKDSKLTESDITDIISECSSVLVILDGYDEYPDQDVNVDSDVISIIMRNMFQQFEVILTTRSSYLPKKYPAITKRLKLTGFDDNARDQYIQKAVVGDDVTAAEKIKQRLKENPVLGDLCQVPLFFVMFAHMSHESEQFQKFNSVTSFFRYMISCFHSHLKNKMEDENVMKYDLFETEHSELDTLAFEGLSRKDQQIVWSKNYMCERLGRDFYCQYVSIGILVEEEVLDISDDPNAIISEHIQYKTEVRFYHKLFCEWYAANHLSDYASRDDVTFDPWEESEESEKSDSDEDSTNDDRGDQPEYHNDVESQTDHFLKYLDPYDLQYVYRFTCGLNRIAADKIIRYLKTREEEGKFAILCILEKSGKVEDVLRDVGDLCSNQVNIRGHDTLLLQRSTIQLLEIATANKISISRVWLQNCYSTVDLRGGNHLQLKSNLSIPVLTTLDRLDIWESGREITSEEFTGILQYSSKCLALKELLFYYCLLPPSVQAESVSVLRSRNVKVIWAGPVKDYQLNLQSCLWERIEWPSRRVIGIMTEDDYQNEVKEFREEYGKG